MAFDDKTRNKAYKIVCALNVASRAKTYGQSAPHLHQIVLRVMVLMGFSVCSNGGATVVFIMKAVAKNYFPWTPSNRDACGRRKVVEPHNNKMKEMDQHHLRKLRVGKRAYNAA
jgi:hypothetical protein